MRTDNLPTMPFQSASTNSPLQSQQKVRTCCFTLNTNFAESKLTNTIRLVHHCLKWGFHSGTASASLRFSLRWATRRNLLEGMSQTRNCPTPAMVANWAVSSEVYCSDDTTSVHIHIVRQPDQVRNWSFVRIVIVVTYFGRGGTAFSFSSPPS